jgi:hypothetical protein
MTKRQPILLGMWRNHKLTTSLMLRESFTANYFTVVINRVIQITSSFIIKNNFYPSLIFPTVLGPYPSGTRLISNFVNNYLNYSEILAPKQQHKSLTY